MVEGINERLSSSNKKLMFLVAKKPTIFTLDGWHKGEVMREGEAESLVHGLTLCIKPTIPEIRSKIEGKTGVVGLVGESVEGCLPKYTR